MLESFEQPKPIQAEQTPEAERDIELFDLKPEEKIFLDTIVASIHSDRKTYGHEEGYLGPSIVHSIAEINLKTALRIVQQEKKTRIEVLAELANLVQSKGSDINIDSIIEQIETAVDAYTKETSKDIIWDHPGVIMTKASLQLESIRPEVAEKLFAQAKAIVSGQEKYKGFGIPYINNEDIGSMIQIIAEHDPARAESLLKEFENKYRSDNSNTIGAIIKKYLELGDTDSAFRVARENGNAAHMALAGEQIAKTDTQGLISAITEKWVTKKEYYSLTSPYSPERAIKAYSRIADALFRTGNSEIGQQFIQEAERTLETIVPENLDQKDFIYIDNVNQRKRATATLIPVLAHLDPDRALDLLEKSVNDEDEGSGLIRKEITNQIAAITSVHNPSRAWEIYQTTDQKSHKKKESLIEIALEYMKKEGPEKAQFLLDEIDKFRIGTEFNEITPQDLAKLSKFFPEKALELLGKIKYIYPTFGNNEQDTFATLPQDIFTILERNSLPLDKQRDWIVWLDEKFSTGDEKSILNASLLDRMSGKNSRLLDEEGILSYFRSLDPQNENDITTLKNLLTTGLIPECKIEELIQKGDARSLHLSSLILCAELYKKIDFDIVSFYRLMTLAQSENESIKGLAFHSIKLLQPKIVELFYSSDHQSQDALKKLYGLSPEAQQWLTDLDKYIAENFDTQNLIRLVTKIGQEETLQIFPQAIAKAREEILVQLSSNEDLADYFLENLHLYHTQPWIKKGIERAIKHFSVAQKFMKAVNNDATPWKDDPWVANVYAKAKLTEPKYKESQGFYETDPYENHHWKFTGEQIKIAGVLSDALAGKADEKSIRQLGLSPETLKTLSSIEQQLSTAYENFLAKIESSSTFPEEDKNALLHPENSSVRMTDLRGNIRSFIARYLTQVAEGDITKLNEKLANTTKDLEVILQKGLDRFIQIYEVDVPLYDKLYEEFDNLRETGQYPLEVYLGRDGIYAWLGRRAQDVARRRKLGLEGRKQAREAGEIIEIQPKYLIYPRYFRDYISYETKREFLEQEGISPDADPMFYDTGYTGTIPEQIMWIMDFENEEIERRIRLLSAPVVHRRVKGITENARNAVIEYIEHNAKTEDAAVGLIKDPETGKIRPIAEPTTPEEQFYFMMLKQAIGRHYWLKEQLHHEPSGNINLDSEHYLIRIRKEYSSLMPPEFISDPKTYLAKQGELLKGSKGEGEYPDEEIVLFKLLNDTEIIAKRVELRKVKEAKKEFSILIAAKKANLPTAEPIGFLSGKTEEDSSYLLMTKLDGFSGRKFEKHLRGSGRYSDGQITAIMQTVAKKNEEMAKLFRQTLNIDKQWRIKDTMIKFDEETGEITSVVPIDWERVQIYDPENPEKIEFLE